MVSFEKRSEAERFAISWGRYSLSGHIVGAGEEDVEVTIFNVTEQQKKWVENYISK